MDLDELSHALEDFIKIYLDLFGSHHHQIEELNVIRWVSNAVTPRNSF
jgi:hypothetical protein